MIELEAIAIDEADGGVRPKKGNGEHFQQITTHLKGRLNLALEFGFRRRAILVLSFDLDACVIAFKRLA